jgi:3-isopropylmalate dehydrogenase
MTEQTIDLTVIGGDGIGPEVTESAVRVLEATEVPLSISRYEAGDVVYERDGTALPEETLAAAKDADAVLFGAAGETAADVIIRLRQELETYVNLRPTPLIPDGDRILLNREITIVRENTEGLYVGDEQETSPGTISASRKISREASERIARYAFEYASKFGHEKITAVHKANVLQKSDGLFLECARSVAEDYPQISYDEGLVDATATRLVMHPDQFDMILTTNLFGDIISDLVAGLVGGLGVCPSANIGDEHALFEPVHGSAPDIAGTNQANPTASILCGAMLLRHLDRQQIADRIISALKSVVKSGATTPDMDGSLTTDEMTDRVIEEL